MAKKTNTFQLITVIIFGAFAVIGVIMFAVQKGSSADEYSVEIWGTYEQPVIQNLIADNFEVNDPVQVTYKEVEEAVFDATLVEALAEGVGPDAIILRDDSILRHEAKIFTIPYESFSERSFKDRFVGGAEIFLKDDGVVGVPFTVDPMVMYWNRSIFGNARVVEPPKYWDELSQIVPKITDADFSGNILRPSVALGEFSNITNAKDIISAILMQAGTPIVQRIEGEPTNVLEIKFNSELAPAETALRFYTEFADPVKSVYSWNRSMPNSRDAFISGDLGIYFGFANEVFSIRKTNPNLDFDVALFPQIRDTSTEITNAHFFAFTVMKSSKNIGATITAIGKLSSDKALQYMIESTGLPPVSRGLLRESPTDAYLSVFYNSALISRSWLDPDKVATGKIFEAMIEDVTSGRLRISSAITRASKSLDQILEK